MNISRFLLFSVFGCALPAFAQPEPPPPQWPPSVLPQEALRLALAEKPLSLHLKNAKLAEALSLLAKQLNISLDVNPWVAGELPQQVSTDIEGQPVRDALKVLFKDVGRESRFQLKRMEGRRSWSLDTDSIHREALPTSGPKNFEMRVLSLNSSLYNDVVMGERVARSRKQALNVVMECETDPSFEFFGSPSVQVTQALDDRGGSLVPKEQETTSDLNWNFNTLNVRLNVPRSDSKKLIYLEGRVTYVICTKFEKWEVVDVLNAKSTSHDFQSDGQTIRVFIRKARLQGKNFLLDIGIVPTSPLPKDTSSWYLFAAKQLLPQISLTDAQGTPLVLTGYRGLVERTDKRSLVQANFVFSPNSTETIKWSMPFLPSSPLPKLVEPISFRLNAPTSLVQTEVPFSFSNLPLP